MTNTGSSAEPNPTGEQSHEAHAEGPRAFDNPEADDGCCGDACTSKTCSRALKALQLKVSETSLHDH